MKAITISQPYASLIARGEKIVENRRRRWNHRGWIVIHAGKGQQYLDADELKEYPTGAAIAVAYLVACLERSSIRQRARTAPDSPIYAAARYTWRQLDEHPHTEGPYCLVLADVKPLVNPVPYRGAQGLFEIPDALINAQLD